MTHSRSHMHHSARARQNVLVPGQPDGGAGTAVCRAARARRGGRPHYSARVALAMGALSLALVAIGCGSAGATSSRRSAGEVATCTASELKIGLVRSFAGLGSAGGIIGFTNRGTSACRLSGWPTFQALGANGRVVKGTQVQGTMYGPYDVHGLPVVTLEPGHPADVVFVGGDGPGRGETRCPPPYRHISVGAPKATHSVLLSAWLPDLDAYLPSCTAISVSMVVQPAAFVRG